MTEKALKDNSRCAKVLKEEKALFKAKTTQKREMGKDTENRNCITIMVGLDYHKGVCYISAFRDFEYASEYALGR